MPAQPASHEHHRPHTAPQAAAAPGADWEAALRAIVGSEHVITRDAAARYAVEGTIPRTVARPGSIEEISRILALADQHRLATVPWGSGLQMHVGAPLSRIDIVLSLERLDQVIAYEPADMTVTVQAGIPLGRLQQVLAERNQFLPLDPPAGPSATIGGCLATRASGPLRAGFGNLRDWLLGVRVVLPGGRITRSGGRVVKNVAGYEMGRLYTGSLGTLAVVVEATFKVQPLPAGWMGLRVTLDGPDAAEAALAALLDSAAEPHVAEWVEPAMASFLGWGRQWWLALGYAGTPVELDDQYRRVQDVLGRTPALQLAPEACLRVDWPALHGELLRAHSGTAGAAAMGDESPAAPPLATLRVSMLSSRLAAYLAEAGRAASRLGFELLGIAHAASGVARIHVRQGAAGGGPPGAEAQAGLINELRELAGRQGGHLIVERAPRFLKELVDVWGPPPADFFLMKGIKEKLDPRRILNPGRFVGGL